VSAVDNSDFLVLVKDGTRQITADENIVIRVCNDHKQIDFVPLVRSGNLCAGIGCEKTEK